MEQSKLWIDTDAGVDDAQAILMALACPDAKVVGISTVRGNTMVHQVSLNVLRLLRVAGHQEIPVYEGCQEALLGNKEDASVYHGLDGFGDVPDPNPPSRDLLQKEHAVNALINTVKDSKGDITLVCLGPLTNIAMAIRLDPNFGKKIKACYIMGGNYEGKGNITMSAEFNFYSDPEAANIVLSDLHAPITMACWELCLKHSLPWTLYEELRQSKTTVCEFLKRIEKKTMATCQESQWEKWILCDELAMLMALDPSVIKTSHHLYGRVEQDGKHTRGQLILDWSKITDNTPNGTIVTELDSQAFVRKLQECIEHANCITPNGV